MNKLIYILTILAMTSCIHDKVVDKKPERLYFLSNCKTDTNFIDKPSYDTAKLKVIVTKEFEDKNFTGKIIKLTNAPAPTDGEVVYYLTPDLGLIYSKNTSWPCYTRLHSTNDTTEKRINEYVDHILLKSDLFINNEISPVIFTRPNQDK